MLDNWQRIEKIVKWTGTSSVNAFARIIGLNRGENLYQIKRGNNGISKDLAEIISAKYPELSKAWILTGEGEMLAEITIPVTEGPSIPYYRMDIVRLIMAQIDVEPSAVISIPIFQDCDLAALYFGRSMTPEIPQGAIVVVKHVEREDILPGEMYLIISKGFHGIRFVRKDPESTTLRLVPKNREDYDEILMDIEQIENLYLIRGVITNKAL